MPCCVFFTQSSWLQMALLPMNSIFSAPSLRLSSSRANHSCPDSWIFRFDSLKPEAPNLSVISGAPERAAAVCAAARPTSSSSSGPVMPAAAKAVDVRP